MLPPPSLHLPGTQPPHDLPLAYDDPSHAVASIASAKRAHLDAWTAVMLHCVSGRYLLW
jgi:hypothetical protein